MSKFFNRFTRVFGTDAEMMQLLKDNYDALKHGLDPRSQRELVMIKSMIDAMQNKAGLHDPIKSMTEVFLIGSRINNDYFIVGVPGQLNGPKAWLSLADTKKQLANFYKMTTIPDEAPEFVDHLRVLINTKPFILKVKHHSPSEEIFRNCIIDRMFRASYSVIEGDHILIQVKPEFFEKYLVEDVVQTIEHTPYINAEGKSVIRVFKTSKGTQEGFKYTLESSEGTEKAARDLYINRELDAIQKETNCTRREAVKEFYKRNEGKFGTQN
jgi:hypothetical protein